MIKDRIYIIDLDRTLIDVEKVMETVQDTCESLEVDFNKIDNKYRELAEKEIPYSPIEDIKNQEKLAEFKKKFIELSQNDRLLFDDSRAFLELLKSKKIDYMILTYGIDDEWQRLKIEASGLSDIPTVIIKDRYKSRAISSWREDGHFNLNSVKLEVYKRCVIVDDRVTAFENLPDNCRGYLLDRGGKLNDRVQIPSPVQVISSLSVVKI